MAMASGDASSAFLAMMMAKWTKDEGKKEKNHRQTAARKKEKEQLGNFFAGPTEGASAFGSADGGDGGSGDEGDDPLQLKTSRLGLLLRVPGRTAEEKQMWISQCLQIKPSIILEDYVTRVKKSMTAQRSRTPWSVETYMTERVSWGTGRERRTGLAKSGHMISHALDTVLQLPLAEIRAASVDGAEKLEYLGAFLALCCQAVEEVNTAGGKWDTAFWYTCLPEVGQSALNPALRSSAREAMRDKAAIEAGLTVGGRTNPLLTGLIAALGKGGGKDGGGKEGTGKEKKGKEGKDAKI